jgi:hypothetical protein
MRRQDPAEEMDTVSEQGRLRGTSRADGLSRGFHGESLDRQSGRISPGTEEVAAGSGDMKNAPYFWQQKRSIW